MMGSVRAQRDAIELREPRVDSVDAIDKTDTVRIRDEELKWIIAMATDNHDGKDTMIQSLLCSLILLVVVYYREQSNFRRRAR